MRYIPFLAIVFLTLLFLGLGLAASALWLLPLIVLAPLAFLGVWDLCQESHSLKRVYPVSAHFRWFFEWLRPYLREYLLDSDHQGRPYSHDQRALVYKRAKNVESVQAFGTDRDPYSPGYEWINHAMQGRKQDAEAYRITIGDADCAKPYSASVFNISAMSFGSLSGRAVEALNQGAKMGNFYHDTGEGGISSHHRIHGGDLVWEIGTGYFGCRTPDGRFDPKAFADRASSDQVRMIEIKLSQGAKPGKGGLLPGAKVTQEIADARGVPIGLDVLSPPGHSAFSDPVGLMTWIAELRELSGGKPVGFKLCVGHRWEFLALVKAMLKTGITPDFIVVDGAEGGTGAAPAELSNHVGTPLREGLIFVVNALTGANLRHRIKIAAAGKVVDGHDMAANIALGADWCNAARPFMFSLGCVQTKQCHTGHCPVGVATQDRWREAGLVVEDKAPRVYHFHRNTVAALSEYVGAAGLSHPWDLRPYHLRIRMAGNEVHSADSIYDFLTPGILLDAPDDTIYGRWWAMAAADRFAAAV
ncbi:FMN-binding glutamate synthase family protein [Fodinicurvata sp. EGI_FJ10296]|uniref:FMN-binding glutamate synthase family protein n=1 Tax=Fodinicurvata sp. EGI_FJ10296 TaxID=3231908 RepID=UPI0034511D82